MSRYRTEIVIPSDRIVTLHLPEEMPEGRARVVVESEPAGLGEPADLDPEAGADIEWWEEFGDDAADDEPWGLRVRLGALEA